MPRTSKAAALAVVSTVAAALAVLVAKFSVSTDLSVFLPEGRSVVERVLMTQLDRGLTSNLVFAGVTGAKPGELARLNRELAGRLAAERGIVQVLNGERALSEEDRQWVMDNRYHLTPSALAERFSVEGLVRSFEERLRGLASPMAPLEKKFLARDPTGEIVRLLERWQGELSGDRGPATRDGLWFSADEQRTLMMIELQSGGLDFAGQERAVDAIERIFDEVATPGSRLILSGPAVFAVETRDVIQRDARVLSLAAAALVGAFLFAAFRSVALLLLVLAPLGCGALVGAAAVLLAFGDIHGVTLAFGITLIGVAVDYPIHFFSHLRDGRGDAERSIRRIWPTLRLGVVSTVVAYAVLALSEYGGLRQIGLFTVVGLLTAAAVTRWVLPFLLPRELPLARGLPGVHGALRALGARLAGLGPWTLLLIPAVVAVLALGPTPLRDLDMDSLSAIDLERRAEDRALRADLGFWYGGRLAMVAAGSSEAALKGSEELRVNLDRLVERGVIDRYDMAAGFIPSQARQRRQIDAIPAPDELRARVAEALAESPFREDAFERFIDEAAAARERPLLSVESLRGTRMGERLEALLFESNGLWVAPILLHGVRDESALESLNRDAEGFQSFYLNIKAEASEILARSLARVVPLLGLGVAAIYVLLWIAYRHPLRPLRVLFPTFSAVAVTLGALNLAGVSLTLMHLTSLLLIVGLGLDYALFYNRLSDHAREWGTTFKALWVSSFTTVLVFGILCFSNTPPLRAIGLTVGLGAFLCLAFGACWTARVSLSRSGS